MADETPRDPRLGRRMMVLRVAGLGAAAGAVASTAEAAPPAMPHSVGLPKVNDWHKNRLPIIIIRHSLP